MSEASKIVVVGLGYVGLPLALALTDHSDVIGYDIDTKRIAELQGGHDRTREVDRKRLAASCLTLTADPADCDGADYYIVTVPTPIDGDNKPDLSALLGASRAIARLITPPGARRSFTRPPSAPASPKRLTGPRLSAAASSSAVVPSGSANRPWPTSSLWGERSRALTIDRRAL